MNIIVKLSCHLQKNPFMLVKTIIQALPMIPQMSLRTYSIRTKKV